MKRHAEFAKRLEIACENSPVVPEKGKGQQTYLAEKLGISQEAVRRYFEGDSRPKPKKMTELAELLGTDEAWLALGKNSFFTNSERIKYKASAEASVYLVLSIFTSNGFSCALNENENVETDLFAIKAGHQLSICATTAVNVSENTFLAPIKKTYNTNLNLVVVPVNKVERKILVIDNDVIAKNSTIKSDMHEIKITISGSGDDLKFKCGRKELTLLEDSNVL